MCVLPRVWVVVCVCEWEGSCVLCVVCCSLCRVCGVCVVALRGGMAMGTGWERAVCTWLRCVVRVGGFGEICSQVARV